MFDIKKIEAEARAELAAEQATKAKGLIKAKLAQIAGAEKVLANLKGEYEALLRDVASA